MNGTAVRVDCICVSVRHARAQYNSKYSPYETVKWLQLISASAWNPKKISNEENTVRIVYESDKNTKYDE